MKQSEQFSNSSCADQIHLAERELSAFTAAVVELFGTDQARVSVEDWLEETELMNVSPRSTHRDWRSITIAASVRLANRLNVAVHRQTSLGISTSMPASNCSWEDSCSRLDSPAQSAPR
jgi:hypothetical protein